VFPEDKFTDEDILKRYVDFYGDERIFAEGLIPSLRLKLSSRPEKGNIKAIGDKVIEEERSREFELSKSDQGLGRDVFVKATVGSNMKNPSYSSVQDYLPHFF
jgi:hypothetical protein